jgi:hypothetical protein
MYDYDIYDRMAERKKDAKLKAPVFCKQCDNLFSTLFLDSEPFCKIKEDFCPANIKDCPILGKLPKMCLECSDVSSCHLPDINQWGINYCTDFNNKQLERETDLINAVIFKNKEKENESKID